MHSRIISTWHEVRRLFAHEPVIGSALTFCAIFLLFASLLAQPYFPDPDSFYHARMALELSHGTVLHQFPWLPFTTLSHHFADLAFLYHAYLVPFVTFGDPLLGIKFSHALLGGAAASVLYIVLKRSRVAVPFAFVLAIFVSSPFLFRAGLVKAPLVSLIFLGMGLLFLFQGRARALAILSFFYVWSYGGWPLLIVATLSFLTATVIRAIIQSLSPLRNPKHEILNPKQITNNSPQIHKRVWRIRYWNLGFVSRLEIRNSNFKNEWTLAWKSLGAVLAGCAIGLVLNPSFPDNLYMMWQQGIQIALINYQHVVGVGGEWYPYALRDLFKDAWIAVMIMISALAAFIVTIRKQSAASITLFLLGAASVFLTLKSRRYIEYSVPLSILFAAYALKDAFAGVSLKSQLRQIAHLELPLRAIGLVFCAVLIGSLMAQEAHEFAHTRRDLASGLRVDAYQNSATYIRDHAQEGAIVLHSDWDEMPVLMYWAPNQRYIAGLDPTFFYLQDETRYHLWVNITTGKEVPDLFESVTKNLGASWVFITKDHTAMHALFIHDAHFQLAYEDNDAWVYVPIEE